jgi:glycosyltransferase involved in cell wall biosynthesis
MHVAILSGCIRELGPDYSPNSSSELFESALAHSLSPHARVTVVSSAARHEQWAREVRLLPAQSRLTQSLRSAARTPNGNTPVTHVVLFGYDPRKLFALSSGRRRSRAKIVSFSFDHHWGAIEHKRRLRRTLIDAYFMVGLQMLRGVDGVVLLNPLADSVLPIRKTSRLVSRVGAVVSAQETKKLAVDAPFTVVFAGSLERYNALGPLLEAFSLLKSPHLRLEIFGSGFDEPLARRAAESDARITFHGRVPNAAVMQAMRRAHLVACLRTTDHIVARVSFPSKVVEAMAQRRPVLTTDFTKHLPLDELATVARDLAPRTIADAIHGAQTDMATLERKADRASTYVATRHTWDLVGSELAAFFRTL